MKHFTFIHKIKIVLLVILLGGSPLCMVTGYCSVTEVSVATGHTLTGVRHRLFKSSKFASGHSLSGQCVGAPAGGSAARQCCSVTSQ